MPRYYLRATTGGVSGEDWGKLLSTDTNSESPAGQTVSLGGSPDTNTNYGCTTAGDPGTTSWDGTYTATVDISSGTNKSYGDVRLVRYNSSLVEQEEKTSTEGEQEWEVAQTYTYTFTSTTWSSPAAGDRLALRFISRNANHAGVSHDVDTIDTYVDAPYATAVAGSSAGASTVSGTLEVTRELAATSAGASTVTGALNATDRLCLSGGETGHEATEPTISRNFAGTVTSPTRNGGYAWRTYSNTTTATVNFALADARDNEPVDMDHASVFTHCGLRVATAPSANSEPVLTWVGQSSTFKGELRINSSRYLVLYDKDQSVAETGTTQLSLDTWYSIEADVGTGTSAAYAVRINGSGELSGAADFTTSNHARVYFGKANNRNSNIVDYYFDDIVLDGKTSIGDAYITALLPNADGAQTGWTAEGSNKWEDVKDNDLAEVYTSADADVYSADVQSSTDVGLAGNIKSVSAWARPVSSGSATGFQFRIDSGASSKASTAFDLGASFDTLHLISDTDPDGSGWTASAIDAVEVACVSGDTIQCRVDVLRLFVETDEPSSTDKELAGTSDGASANTADLQVAYEIAGTSDGQSADTATLDVERGIAASSAGQSAITADLSTSSAIAGQSDGVSTAGGTLDVEREIAAQSDGQSAVTAALTVTLGAYRRRVTGWESGKFEAIASVGTIESSTTTKRSGRRAFRSYPTGSAVGYIDIGEWRGGAMQVFSPDIDTSYHAVWVYLASSEITAANREPFFILRAGGGQKIALSLNASRQIQVRDAAYSVVDTTTAAITVGQWQCLEVYCQSGLTTGEYEIWLDDASVSSGSSMNTNVSGMTYAQLGKTNNIGSQGFDLYFDDYAMDTAARVGQDSRVKRMYQDGNGTHTDWTANTGTKWEAVDDETPDNATTYIYASTANDQYTSTIESATESGISGMIGSVSVYHVNHEVTDNDQQIRSLIRTGGTTYNGDSGTAADPNGEYIGAEGHSWETNPGTTKLWTPAELDAIEAGVELLHSYEIRTTQIVVEVEYVDHNQVWGETAGQSGTTADLTVTAEELLDGTSDGQSTTSAVLSVTRAIAGQSDGQSATTALLGFAVDLAAQSDGQSTTAALLGLAHDLAGTSDGVSTVAGTLEVERAIAGQSTGQSAIGNAQLDAQPLLAGQSDGACTITDADLTIEGTKLLAATVPGTSGTTAALDLDLELAATSDGQSATQALLGLAHDLAATSDGQSATQANLVLSVALEATSDGQSAISDATLDAQPLLAAQSDGQSGISADLTTEGDVVLAATVPGASGISAALQVAYEMAATSAGASTVAGVLETAREIAASSAGTSGVTAGLTVTYSLAGTSDGQSATTADLIAVYELATVSAGQSANTATLTTEGEQALAATVAGTSANSAALDVLLEVAGQADGQSSTAALLDRQPPLAASTAGTSTAGGTLTLSVGLATQSDGQSAISDADLTVTASETLMEAVAAGQAAISALLGLDLLAAAQSDGQSGTTATLTKTVPIAGQSDGQSATTADLLPVRGLAAQSDGNSTAGAGALVDYALIGQSDGQGGTSVQLIALYALAGTVNGQSATSAELAELYVPGQSTTWTVPFRHTSFTVPDGGSTFTVPRQPTEYTIP